MCRRELPDSERPRIVEFEIHCQPEAEKTRRSRRTTDVWQPEIQSRGPISIRKLKHRTKRRCSPRGVSARRRVVAYYYLALVSRTHLETAPASERYLPEKRMSPPRGPAGRRCRAIASRGWCKKRPFRFPMLSRRVRLTAWRS